MRVENSQCDGFLISPSVIELLAPTGSDLGSERCLNGQRLAWQRENSNTAVHHGTPRLQRAEYNHVLLNSGWPGEMFVLPKSVPEAGEIDDLMG